MSTPTKSVLSSSKPKIDKPFFAQMRKKVCESLQVLLYGCLGNILLRLVGDDKA